MTVKVNCSHCSETEEKHGAKMTEYLKQDDQKPPDLVKDNKTYIQEIKLLKTQEIYTHS